MFIGRLVNCIMPPMHVILYVNLEHESEITLRQFIRDGTLSQLILAFDDTPFLYLHVCRSVI